MMWFTEFYVLLNYIINICTRIIVLKLLAIYFDLNE